MKRGGRYRAKTYFYQQRSINGKKTVKLTLLIEKRCIHPAYTYLSPLSNPTRLTLTRYSSPTHPFPGVTTCRSASCRRSRWRRRMLLQPRRPRARPVRRVRKGCLWVINGGVKLIIGCLILKRYRKKVPNYSKE